MKILYLTDQTYLHGGIEKVLSQKANFLADRLGYTVHICTYNQHDHAPAYTFSNNITHSDLQINYEAGRSYFHHDSIKKAIYHYNVLGKFIKGYQPDIIVSSSFGPDYYFLPFLSPLIPKIKEFHSTRAFTLKTKNFKQKLLNRLGTFSEKKFDALVILNEDERPFYAHCNIVIIPNPAEIDSPSSPLSAHKIIAAGRLCYQKNFEDLIEIAKLVHPRFPEWQIDIYGDDYGNKSKELEQMIQQLGLQNVVSLKGSTSDLKKTFQDYSIYAMTSNHETFPMVILEALSVGLPVVSYKCPTGPDRIVTNNSDGFIVPYKDKNAFASQLEKLMRDQTLRQEMGKNALANVERFEIEKVMQDWITLFKNLVEKQ